ncbi:MULTISPECIES: BrnT family toxin [Microcoleaceae]|uniref:BrnT family toxin n=1 Tax=Microcoleaceae TaxID=1892252 RepID=UPI002238C55D|nr:BrnT family toxin [Lyngbya sp. CCAP 1446/10]
MQFEWDENKNAQNLKKHGISFEEAQEIFDGIVFNAIDERFDYGEIREISIGAIQGVVIVTVAHTERNGVYPHHLCKKSHSSRKKYLL